MFFDSDFPDDRGVMQSRLRMVLESGPGSGNSSDVLRSHRINPLCGFILRSRGGGRSGAPCRGRWVKRASALALVRNHHACEEDDSQIKHICE